MNNELKTYTIADIRSLNPCYDPSEKVPDDWSGTVLDILKLENVTPHDRLWVVTKYLSDKQNRLFAVWCAREALKLIDDPDPRSVNACDIAEKFAKGEATEEELAAAWDAAWDASRAAAWDAARDAARDAAWDAAWDAARDAAWAAAWAAARDAAWDAARAAARAAAWDAQLKRLIEAIEKKEWD